MSAERARHRGLAKARFGEPERPRFRQPALEDARRDRRSSRSTNGGAKRSRCRAAARGPGRSSSPSTIPTRTAPTSRRWPTSKAARRDCRSASPVRLRQRLRAFRRRTDALRRGARRHRPRRSSGCGSSRIPTGSDAADLAEGPGHSASGIAPERADVAFGLDPGRCHGDRRSRARAAAAYADAVLSLRRRSFAGPSRWLDARPYHEAGASEAQELGASARRRRVVAARASTRRGGSLQTKRCHFSAQAFPSTATFCCRSPSFAPRGSSGRAFRSFAAHRPRRFRSMRKRAGAC